MKKYILCCLLLGGFGIGETSVEGMELSTTEEKNPHKYIVISSAAIPNFPFKGKERIRFIPESKIEKIPAVGGIPSLKDLCLDFLASQIGPEEDGPSEGEKEVGLGQVEIVSQEEESQPGGEKAASSSSFLQRVDHQIEEFLKSQSCILKENLKSLKENLKFLLKVRICQKRGDIWEEWRKLSKEEKQRDICFWQEIGKECFLDFYNLENEENLSISPIGIENFWENTDHFYPMVRKIKIHKLENIFSWMRILSFLKEAENLESICFAGEGLFGGSLWTSCESWKNFFTQEPCPHLFHSYVYVMNANPFLNLKELILDGVFMGPNKIEKSIIKGVWKTLQEAQSLQKLEILNLRWNCLGDKLIQKLVALLKDKKFLPCLRFLILEGNEIRREIGKELWEALKERPCFQVLDLTGNPLFQPSFSSKEIHSPNLSLFNKILFLGKGDKSASFSSHVLDSRFQPKLWERLLNLRIQSGIDPEKLFEKKTSLKEGGTLFADLFVNLTLEDLLFAEPFISAQNLWIEEWENLSLYAVADKKTYGHRSGKAFLFVVPMRSL